MNYYPFHIGDYKSHTEHYDLLEDLAFRRMLDWCYLHEKPLPLDIDDIARLIRMRTHNECIAYVLREQFIETDNGYINKRVSKEVGKYQEKSEKAKKSAEARWKKKPADNHDLSNANAMPTQCESNANQEPRTKNHKPVTNIKTSDDSNEVARHLENKILFNNPKAKTNYQAWSEDIDRAIRIDKRTKDELIDCINWIYSDAGTFWQANILSGKKLREKYDTMFAQANRPQQGSNQNLDEVSL